EFARAVKTSNPFINNRITQPDATDVDVGTIHEREFNQLKKRILGIRESRGTCGVLLLGGAGVGKSHLLARLFRWAHEQATGTVVCLHNVLASPERMPRYLLGAMMNTLAGHRPNAYPESTLYAILNRAIHAELGAAKFKGSPDISRRVEVLGKIGREFDPEGLVMPVFVAFLKGAVAAAGGDAGSEANAKAALEWLSGETIEAELAKAIGLKSQSPDGVCMQDDVAVQRTLDVVCRLCGKARRPLVLCIDQVDNLDKDKVTSLSSFLQAALDNGHDLAVVISGVKQSMLEFERDGVIPQAAWDRLAQFTIELNRISPAEARKIVEERVQRFMTPFKQVEGLSALRARDALTPVGTKWLDKRLESVIEVRPRDIISWVRERWEQVQDSIEQVGPEAWLAQASKGEPADGPGRRVARPIEELIQETVAKKVTQATNERTLNPERLPPDADNMATLAFELLKRCEGRQQYTLRGIERVKSKLPAAYDLLATEVAPGGSTAKSGLVFITVDNANASAWALKRLVDDDNPPTHQILITDEERRPLRLGKKGQELLDKLRARSGFQHLKLAFEDHAALDALSVVLGSARVGDLEIEDPSGKMRTIDEQAWLDVLHGQGFFHRHPLLRELLTESAPQRTSPSQAPAPSTDVIRERMAAELHWRLGMTGSEMTEILIARESLDRGIFTELRPRVIDVARQMHGEGHLFVTAQDDDVFVQFRKQAAMQ
ncbi:MAG TPA: AAA family ATPase, partial [Polyangiaceae bacterium]